MLEGAAHHDRLAFECLFLRTIDLGGLHREAGSLQPADQITSLIGFEPGVNRLGDHLTEAVDGGDVLDRCRHDGVHRSEGGGEGLAIDLADLGNAQTEEEIAEWARLGALDGRLEIFDRLGADAVEFEHLVEVEGVEVGDVGEQAEAHESVDVLLAEVFDIEGIAPDKVLDTAADLAIAVEVHAMGCGGGLITNQPLAAHRTVRGKHPGLR